MEMNSTSFESVINIIENLSLTTSQVNEDEICSAVSDLVCKCKVPVLPEEDVLYDDNLKFVNTAVVVEKPLQFLLRLLEELCCAQTKGLSLSVLSVKHIMIESALCAAQYQNGHSGWSNEKCADISKRILCTAGRIHGICTTELLHFCDDVESAEKQHAACSEVTAGKVMQPLLQQFVQGFRKDNWKSQPGQTAVFQYLLFNMKEPYLVEHLGYLLPPALFIVDDWQDKYKLIGIQCLHHILDNCAASELRWYGRCHVIYDALKPLLYSREPAVLREVYLTILKAAKVIETDPAKSINLKGSYFDLILQEMIGGMMYEDKLPLRKAYSCVLLPAVDSMGIFAVRWSQDLMGVFKHYLSTCGSHTVEDCINILKVMQVFIQNCWPRIHIHLEALMEVILQLVYDVTSDSQLNPQTRDSLLRECEMVIGLLTESAPSSMKCLIEALDEVDIHPEGRTALKKILRTNVL